MVNHSHADLSWTDEPEDYSAGSRLRTDDFSKSEEFLTEFSKRQEEQHNKWNKYREVCY